MKRDIANWTQACPECQQSKIQRHVKAPLQAFPVSDSRFDHVHIDIVGPLPPSKGYAYLFTCIDRYTRWPEAIPMIDATAESCASAFLSGYPVLEYLTQSPLIGDNSLSLTSGKHS